MPEKIAAAEMLSSELKGKKRDGSCRTRTDSDSSYIVEEWLQKEDKSSEKKNASCLNKVGSALQARRPEKNLLFLSTPKKSFKGRALTGSVKLKSNQKRDDEKVEGLDLTFIESSHHNNLVPFFQKDEIF